MKTENRYQVLLRTVGAHAHARTHTHVYACTCTHTHARVHMHTHTRTRVRMHTHTQTQTSLSCKELGPSPGAQGFGGCTLSVSVVETEDAPTPASPLLPRDEGARGPGGSGAGEEPTVAGSSHQHVSTATGQGLSHPSVHCLTEIYVH